MKEIEKTLSLGISKRILKEILLIAGLTSIILLAPVFKNQFITGTLVNAVLFISLAFLGIRSAMAIAVAPSLISLWFELLPFVLAPFIPFIVIGNTILVIVFSFLKKKNYWLSIVLASFCKFLFLFASSILFARFFSSQAISLAVARMMSWPQLITALMGGVLAKPLIKFLSKK